MIAFEAKMRSQQHELNREKQKLEKEKALVRQEENKNRIEKDRLMAEQTRIDKEKTVNWIEKNRNMAEKMRLESEEAIMKRDMELLKERENQVKVLEERRRRNRFVSS